MDAELEANIIKTAEYVREHGKVLEDRLLRESEDKFPFLNSQDANHSYYVSLLNGETESVPKSKRVEPTDTVPEEPPSFLFINYDENHSVPSSDLEIIKRTAEFAVTSGGEASIGTDGALENAIRLIQDKFGNNETFKFLEHDHTLYQVFIGFVNRYAHIVHNKRRRILPQHKLIEQCFKRATYNEYTSLITTNNDNLQKSFKIRFAAIKWLDFINNEKCIVKLDQWYKEQKIEDDGRTIFKTPLKFEELAQKNISKELTKKALNEYFLKPKDAVINKEAENTKTANEPTKKRKGKIIKEAGETRMRRKKRK
ncbi:similar to Saccharomyces cerevisiae YJL203W PRP21 Subunit of the SF3a splicing factor complex, required for spliceosome assembly [Maudiozyma barnettii]|uniref:Similar to Saccharomyces cerevisiae YJL203W PRP21 Subunit of the SF3a splicing factor complex, required for spliceosome assembly n=1 Tax=Maudiozyma barnettii TaxID=61262 RepID=A0A8H2VFW0_9SACH|nr:Prp21p [Kazachstania barnettii]CAB4254691.1 similar to Saccharomyces cerevisiae YJL203W PRP21 Subunit of the SF3a splicing factor complex, required for spliceosome assembly [Kazachstania barnettii]CAD1782733.1 similar to Saccharomyces cerevisiae YJL203W PRP21 Subunit of the SF3a splicing factor complex, required for spliceosome assembly [Kazachstania barnettii]